MAGYPRTGKIGEKNSLTIITQADDMMEMARWL